MATTINATTGAAGGVVITPDASGIVQVQSNGVNTNAQAWVNFAASNPCTVYASYNISSVTYVSTGQYTVNFTNAFVDSNYCIVMGLRTASTSTYYSGQATNGSQTTTSSRITIYGTDASGMYAAYFR